MTYQLVVSATPDDLKTEVNAKMVEGWQCQGGVSMTQNVAPKTLSDYYLYAQAMVKQ